MFRIIYASSATVPFTGHQLEELLQKSRHKNFEAEITGMLLYKDGYFMQTLEGPEPAVKALVETIRNDPRHRNFNILMEGRILERSFNQWSMGFKKMTKEPMLDDRGYFDSDDLSLMSSQFLQNPTVSLGAFLSFKDTI